MRGSKLPCAETTKSPESRQGGDQEFVSTVLPVCGSRRCPDRNCCKNSCPRASCVTRPESSFTRSSRSPCAPGARPEPSSSRSSSRARRRRSRPQATPRTTTQAIAAPNRPKKMRSFTGAARLGNAGTYGRFHPEFRGSRHAGVLGSRNATTFTRRGWHRAHQRATPTHSGMDGAASIPHLTPRDL